MRNARTTLARRGWADRDRGRSRVDQRLTWAGGFGSGVDVADLDEAPLAGEVGEVAGLHRDDHGFGAADRPNLARLGQTKRISSWARLQTDLLTDGPSQGVIPRASPASQVGENVAMPTNPAPNDTSRNSLRRTHNPKVVGSNPTPATTRNAGNSTVSSVSSFWGELGFGRLLTDGLALATSQTPDWPLLRSRRGVAPRLRSRVRPIG